MLQLGALFPLLVNMNMFTLYTKNMMGSLDINRVTAPFYLALARSSKNTSPEKVNDEGHKEDAYRPPRRFWHLRHVFFFNSRGACN